MSTPFYEKIEDNKYRINLDKAYILAFSLTGVSIKPEKDTQGKEVVTAKLPLGFIKQHIEDFNESREKLLLEELERKLKDESNLIDCYKELPNIFKLIVEDVSKKFETVKNEAIKLARDHKRAEPNIKKTFWFANLDEIRLVEVEDNIPASVGEEVEVFYFPSSESIPLNSGIGIIRPEESNNLKLPENWGGSWAVAEKLEDDE